MKVILDYEQHEWNYSSPDKVSIKTKWGSSWSPTLFRVKVRNNSYNSDSRKYSTTLWFFSQAKGKYICKRKFFPNKDEIDKWVETNVAKMKLNEL